MTRASYAHRPVLHSLEYRKLGAFTYHVLTDPEEVTAMLRYWVGDEWQIDLQETPGGLWIAEWMRVLEQKMFTLAEVPFSEIGLNAQLMVYEDFEQDLTQRATEREASILRGMSLEPLMVRSDLMELMDGYTRYEVLRRHDQESVYIYTSSD